MKRSPKKEAKFLSELAAGKSITAACRAIGIGRPAAYQWRKDPKFAKRWEDALEAGTDLLEDEASRRALKQSDTLLIFLLKARRPNTYRDNIRVESIDVSQLTDEQLEAIASGTVPSGVIAPAPAAR